MTDRRLRSVSDTERVSKTPEETRFSTVLEVARTLRVSKMTVYRLVESGILPGYQIGRSMRIPTAAVWDYLRGCRIEPSKMSKVKAL